MIKKIIISIVVAVIIIQALIVVIIMSTDKPAPTPVNSTNDVTNSVTNNTTTISTDTSKSDKTYTLADISKHKTTSDCWTTVNGGVYDLTPFVNNHPGGVSNITKVCGIDGSTLFGDQHGGERRPANELSSLKIGSLSK